MPDRMPNEDQLQVAKVIDQLPWLKHAVISTDDPEVSEEGRRFGLGAPFIRAPGLAHWKASGSDVLFHAWWNVNDTTENISTMRSTWNPQAQLRRPEDVEHTLNAQ